MITKKLFLVLSIFFVLNLPQFSHAQSSNVAIVLNEYATTNISGPADNFGNLSDWVELYNAHTTSVSLNGYYLSNDRFNLFKWKFPANFTLPIGGYGVVWLSGKNVSNGAGTHTNFTLDQCKNQWLILSTSTGVVRDSIFIQKTKAGHVRGRVDKDNIGIGAWRLYTTNSIQQPNPLTNNYKDYLPMPKMFPANPTSTIAPGSFTASPNTGSFPTDGAQIIQIRMNGYQYDTIQFPCMDIWYTTNGDYPVPGSLNTTLYTDSLASIITMPLTGMVRAIAVPNTTRTGCPMEFLPSFCETNTYFIDQAHQEFSKEFGGLSIALDRADTSWFNSQGQPPSTTIHVEYYDNKKQVTEGYAIMNRPPNEAWNTQQRGYYITIDDKRGFGCNFEGNIFNVAGLGTTSRTVFPTLHLYGGDIESNSSPNVAATATAFGTGMRDVFVQTLAAKYNLNVNPLHIKPVITFVNGKYWGVYNFKEVFDKHYESYYNGQPEDKVDMCFYHNTDGSVSYPDGSVSTYSNNFRSTVYDVIENYPLTNNNKGSYYSNVMEKFDKSSFMDYMIMNSFVMNSEIWNYNVAFAKGWDLSKPGNKWHYFLWNMPTAFNFTVPAGTGVLTNTNSIANSYLTPCSIHSGTYQVSQRAHNGHGNMLVRLFNTNKGNASFRLEYQNRYQDLLNGPFKCENLMKHYNYLDSLYMVEMRCHENPGCLAGPGKFVTAADGWDSTMAKLRNNILYRCDFIAKTFTANGCYGVKGPYPITVDVEPAGAGKVKLNTVWLENYPWVGNYYSTTMSFKAVPSNTTYAFHHWEFNNHVSIDPLSNDSVAIQYFTTDYVKAVFTDKTRDIGGGTNIPTGFTPNGDGHNDYFGPLGSGEFVSQYQMTIWNRWGQEVFRSTDPTAQGWDGTYNGQQSPTGVYAYIITYNDIYGQQKQAKGNVTLTR